MSSTSSDKIMKHSNIINDIDINNQDLEEELEQFNPLVEPLPWWYRFYRRIRLVPWWLRYNIGMAEQTDLRDKIIELSTSMRLDNKIVSKIIRHAVSEFSKHGLGVDYYGYHNIDHELEVAYFTLLAANGEKRQEYRFSQKDLTTLFLAALFHDYDPLKRFDKPHEDSVERFIRNDTKIKDFIDNLGISIDIVIALIYRTAYPFKGSIAEHSNKRIQELFTSAGIPENDVTIRKHYEDLGWFLSISDRIAGYSLGNFEHSMELARRNAHSLGWHPSVINTESVKYFTSLKEEKEMFERVLDGVSDEYKKNFSDNVMAFREAWAKEVEIKSSIRNKQLDLTTVVEGTHTSNSNMMESVLNIHKESPAPMTTTVKKFKKSLTDRDAILVTLRLINKDGEIVGYANGGRLENYTLRRGTHDENLGRRNTAYIESICVKPDYWGETGGGRLLRLEFHKEAKHRGCKFVTGYVHREVAIRRINRGESVEIVQKYNPDKLDYYRADVYNLIISTSEATISRGL
ncbi:MAG: GNAT family N-acetyltransferase [Candidatus Nitrosopolaris sp.]